LSPGPDVEPERHGSFCPLNPTFLKTTLHYGKVEYTDYETGEHKSLEQEFVSVIAILTSHLSQTNILQTGKDWNRKCITLHIKASLSNTP